MSAEIVIMTFDGEKNAWRAESALRMMRARQLLGMQYVATLRCDRTGQVEMSFRRNLPVNLKDQRLLFLCQLVNAFFGTDLTQAEQLVEAGLDRHLVEQLHAALSPGDSGLVIYIPPESLAEANLATLALRRQVVSPAWRRWRKRFNV
jgi:uncharacterized membrane protein